MTSSHPEFGEGYDAADTGAQCPYDPASWEYQEWQDGYEERRRELAE